MSSLRKAVSIESWKRVLARQVESLRSDLALKRLNARMAEIGPVSLVPGDKTVVADGMWWNPNHFFRLRLFIEALSGQGGYNLLGVLRTRSDTRQREAMQAIGFKEFVHIEDDEHRTDDFLAEADRLLATVTSHADLLALPLPGGLPAYTYFDTVLKLAAQPRPALDHPLWRRSLAEVLRNARIYEREFGHRNVAHVVLSHPWKSEWAGLVWASLQRSIPTYHLTGYCESIRIRRFLSATDYLTPVEHMPPADFDELPAAVRSRLAAIGSAALAKRASGSASDINTRYAYDPQRRIADRTAARQALSGQTERPVALVCGHVWYDFPHTFGMTSFTDFRDWIEVTIARIRQVDDVVWLLKPHPTEQWYGGFRLSEAATDLPPHVHLLPTATDAQTALTAADAIVTVHGTIGIEAAAHGVPVLLADRSYFSDWGFAHAARDRADYQRLLGEIADLTPPDQTARQRAQACFALALAEPPLEVGALQLRCDSSGARLYDDIIERYDTDTVGLGREIARIRAFLAQHDLDSYAAHGLVETARRLELAGQPVRPPLPSGQELRL